MRRPLRSFSFLFAAVLILGGMAMFGLSVSGRAEASEGAASPILAQKSQSELEVDLAMMVRDLLPSLLETADLEGEAQGAKARALVDLLGVKALDRLRFVSTADETGSHATVTVTVNDAAPQGLLTRMLALPPGEFRFARYVRPEETLLVLSLESFAQGMDAALSMLLETRDGAKSPFAPGAADSSFLRMAAPLRERILPLLSGEMDVILFPSESDGNRKIPSMAIVWGSTDGPALRDAIFGLLAGKADEAALTALRAIPPDTVGAFAVYPAMANWAYAVNREFFVVTTAAPRLRAMLAEPAGTLAAPPGRHFLRVDARFFSDLIASRLGSNGASSTEDRLKLDALTKIAGASAGAVTIHTTSEADRWTIDMRQEGSMADIQYAALREIVQAAPKMKALEMRAKRYRAAVAQVDAAMTRYGEEHDGLFPKKLDALVKEGYLDALPDLEATPLGKYVEGGYTYLPLRDESGRVVGYYYFVYGPDPEGGYDLLTPSSVKDPANFVAARDGKPDGILSFCYDGIAVRQVELWGN